MATAIVAPATSSTPSGLCTIKTAPRISPNKMPTKVPISIRPLPPTNSSGFSCCGKYAYLTGPNRVECTPMPTTAATSSHRVAHPADAGHQHDGDLQPLDGARQLRLLDFFRDLPRRRGEQHIGQDEQGGNDDVERGRGHAGPRQRIEGEHHQQGRLEQVVVEGAEELGPEKRREAALGQQGELAGCRRGAHGDGPKWSSP